MYRFFVLSIPCFVICSPSKKNKIKKPKKSSKKKEKYKNTKNTKIPVIKNKKITENRK